MSKWLRSNLLILFTTGDRWSSAIENAFEQSESDFRIKTYSDWEQMAVCFNETSPHLIAFDLSEASAQDWKQSLSYTKGEPAFALGDYTLEPYRVDVIRLGFCELLTSTEQAPRFVQLALAAIANSGTRLTIEQMVEHNLPWTGIG